MATKSLREAIETANQWGAVIGDSLMDRGYECKIVQSTNQGKDTPAVVLVVHRRRHRGWVGDLVVRFHRGKIRIEVLWIPNAESRNELVRAVEDVGFEVSGEERRLVDVDIPIALAELLEGWEDENARFVYRAWKEAGGADDDAAGFDAFLQAPGDISRRRAGSRRA
jgi:hypothetical protein